MIEIKSRWNGDVLYRSDSQDFKSALVQAVKEGVGLRCANLRDADLRGADLGGADLRGADLQGADLGYADLRYADLGYADLRYANLSGADLRDASLQGANLGGTNLQDANLRDANLDGVKLNWRSHDLIAEILRQAAGTDVERRKIAGLVLVSRDWCWDQFLSTNDPCCGWALEALSGYVQDGDEAPDAINNHIDQCRSNAEAQS